MKKIIYFIPAIISILFYGFIIIVDGFNSIKFLGYVAIFMMILSAFIMKYNKWWGSIFGIIVGLYMIYMGTQETGQIIKETPFGIIVCFYYVICGVITFVEGRHEHFSKI